MHGMFGPLFKNPDPPLADVGRYPLVSIPIYSLSHFCTTVRWQTDYTARVVAYRTLAVCENKGGQDGSDPQKYEGPMQSCNM